MTTANRQCSANPAVVRESRYPFIIVHISLVPSSFLPPFKLFFVGVLDFALAPLFFSGMLSSAFWGYVFLVTNPSENCLSPHCVAL